MVGVLKEALGCAASFDISWVECLMVEKECCCLLWWYSLLLDDIILEAVVLNVLDRLIFWGEAVDPRLVLDIGLKLSWVVTEEAEDGGAGALRGNWYKLSDSIGDDKLDWKFIEEGPVVEDETELMTDEVYFVSRCWLEEGIRLVDTVTLGTGPFWVDCYIF